MDMAIRTEGLSKRFGTTDALIDLDLTVPPGEVLGYLGPNGINLAPPAPFILGIGAQAFGVWPRAAIRIAYGLIVWSLFVETIAAVFGSNHRLRDTSPLLHMAPVPAAAPNAAAAAWLLGLGLLEAAIGIAAFGRRDLVGA